MPRHRHLDPMVPYRHHEDSIIVLAVHWHISYQLSLRDRVEMLAERGLKSKRGALDVRANLVLVS
jgi:transposase-like protein